MSSSTLLVILLEYICVMNQNTSLSLLTTTTAASPLADSSKSTYTIASFTFELQQNNDDYCTEFPAISLCSLFTSEKEATFTDCLPQGYPVSCVTTSQYCYVLNLIILLLLLVTTTTPTAHHATLEHVNVSLGLRWYTNNAYHVSKVSSKTKTATQLA